MKNEQHALLRIGTMLAFALLAACGETKTGSNGTGSVPSDRFDALVAGTLVSVEPMSVGAAQIEPLTAPIRKDDDANAGTGALRLGMTFEGAGSVLGSLEAAPAVLREGSVQSAVRGPSSAVDLADNRFTVGPVTVIVDVNTLYDGVAGLATLAPGSVVEVAGLPLAAANTVLATRVTRLTGGDPAVSVPVHRTDLAPAVGTRVEIEGIVLGANASGSFVLRTPARDYEVAAGGLRSAAVTSGARVLVTATATGASSLAPATVTVIAGQLTYRVAGVVSEFTSLASLRVRGEPVDLTTAVFRGGNASDVANGRRINVVGTAGPGALRASQVVLQ